jgi:NAD+ synthase (glutamine-hydrolysing)
VLRSEATQEMVVDVGLPVTHCGVRYNCRAFLFRRRVLLLRPKLVLADDGNYREARWFTAWARPGCLESCRLPDCVAAVAGQATAPLGDAALAFTDATLATELCEARCAHASQRWRPHARADTRLLQELFVPSAPHARLALCGVEIFSNGSGSHHQLRKLHTRIELIRGATQLAGGVYLYANQRGCDGGRLYYDGCACVAVNGELVAQGQQFALSDVEVVTATVDLDDIVSLRGAFTSMRQQAASVPRIPFIDVDFRLCGPRPTGARRAADAPQPVRYHVPEEEIALGPACWLWDYLRRSGAAGARMQLRCLRCLLCRADAHKRPHANAGYLLPLSGGADSSSTAAIVGNMCQLAVATAAAGDAVVAADVHRLMGSVASAASPPPLPDAKALAARVLSTVYMGTENSGADTRRRAAALAGEIGASHLSFDIDTVIAALVALFVAVAGRSPRFKARDAAACVACIACAAR